MSTEHTIQDSCTGQHMLHRFGLAAVHLEELYGIGFRAQIEGRAIGDRGSRGRGA